MNQLPLQCGERSTRQRLWRARTCVSAHRARAGQRRRRTNFGHTASRMVAQPSYTRQRAQRSCGSSQSAGSAAGAVSNVGTHVLSTHTRTSPCTCRATHGGLCRCQTPSRSRTRHAKPANGSTRLPTTRAIRRVECVAGAAINFREKMGQSVSKVSAATDDNTVPNRGDRGRSHPLWTSRRA